MRPFISWLWTRDNLRHFWRAISSSWRQHAPERDLGVLILIGPLLLVISIFVLPDVMVPADVAVPDDVSRRDLLELRNNVRGTLLQASAGAILVLGALATWRQMQTNREGHVTERYTRAVEQLGAVNPSGGEKIDVQLGGIYALERLSHDSAYDRRTIVEVLGAFVRHRTMRADWPGIRVEESALDSSMSLTEETLTERSTTDPPISLDARLPAVQAALTVLGRMPRRAQEGPDLAYLDLKYADLSYANLAHASLRMTDLAHTYLTGADLRHADLVQADLTDSKLRRANLSYADIGISTDVVDSHPLLARTMPGTDLLYADLCGANVANANLVRAHLGHATLWGADFTHADLRFAELPNAELWDATLRGADLRGADLTDASELEGATLSKARADSTTQWPEGFDPEAAGVIMEGSS